MDTPFVYHLIENEEKVGLLSKPQILSSKKKLTVVSITLAGLFVLSCIFNGVLIYRIMNLNLVSPDISPYGVFILLHGLLLLSLPQSTTSSKRACAI